MATYPAHLPVDVLALHVEELHVGETGWVRPTVLRCHLDRTCHLDRHGLVMPAPIAPSDLHIERYPDGFRVSLGAINHWLPEHVDLAGSIPVIAWADQPRDADALGLWGLVAVLVLGVLVAAAVMGLWALAPTVR